MTKTLGRIAIVLLLLATATIVIAQPRPPIGLPSFTPGGFGDGLDARAEHGTGRALLRGLLPPPGYLDLSDEQIEATRALFEELRGELEPLHDERRALREQLRDQLNSDRPNAATIGQLVLDSVAVGNQIGDALVATEGPFTALLTSEQLSKWENFRELRELQRQRRDRGGEEGGGDI